MRLSYPKYIIEVVWLVLLKNLIGRPSSIFILVTMSFDISQHTSSRRLTVKWLPVRLSHHRILPSSGQAKRVSYTAVQRSSQQLLFPPIEAIYYFKHRLQNLLLCEFNKERCSVLPYLWDREGFFLLVSCKYYDPEASGLTSLHNQLVVVETSPGNDIFFLSITAVSTYLPFGYSFGRYNGVLAYPSKYASVYDSCSSVPSFVVSLSSDVSSRIPPLRLTNASRRYSWT